MKNIKTIVKAGAVAALALLVFAGSVFAIDYDACTGEGKKYAGLSITLDEDTYPVKCTRVSKGDGSYVQFYGKTSADCAQAASLVTDPEACNSNDLNSIITLIINAIIFIIGIVAVVMIILGGISYATSQGDPGKVKKGKDTILYGIIGLIVALLAFAIVNFVLGALQAS